MQELIEPHVAALMGPEKAERLKAEQERQRILKYGCKKCSQEQERFDGKRCGYCGLEFKAQ